MKKTKWRWRTLRAGQCCNPIVNSVVVTSTMKGYAATIKSKYCKRKRPAKEDRRALPADEELA